MCGPSLPSWASTRSHTLQPLGLPCLSKLPQLSTPAVPRAQLGKGTQQQIKQSPWASLVWPRPSAPRALVGLVLQGGRTATGALTQARLLP